MSRDILRVNQEPLQVLERAIALQQNHFALILARCNYQQLQEQLLEHLCEIHPHLQRVRLSPHIPSLREAIQRHLQLNLAHVPTPTALMVTGLGTVNHLQAVLKSANLARDRFQEQIPCPLVLWVDDHVLARLAQLAQDFKNLAPPSIKFEFSPEELIAGLRREANSLFSQILAISSEPLPASPLIDLSNQPLGNELEFALADLERYGYRLDAELQASLDFARGRQAHGQLELEEARVLYEQSLEYWQTQRLQQQEIPDGDLEAVPTLLEKQAILQFHLGLWWRSYAVMQRTIYRPSLHRARLWFEDALQSYNAANRPELVGQFIHSLCEVAQKQRDWKTLEALSREALELHEQSRDRVRQARDRGFLAEVALQHQAWPTAQAEALRALELLEEAEVQLHANPADEALATALTIARRFQRSWYRFLLGKAQMCLESPRTAISLLEQARQEADPQADLILYLQILEDLIHHHFEMGEYRKAFDVKLELRQVEYRNNLRAFIGAGAVQPHPYTAPYAHDTDANTIISAEIAASGRQQDVVELLNRLQTPKYQLIVIHGPSGVGKSSILNAGLMPSLRRITPTGRNTLPILVQTYSNWQGAIESALDRESGEAGTWESRGAGEPGSGGAEETRGRGDGGGEIVAAPHPLIASYPAGLQPLLGKLQRLSNRHYFIVILFDQFEEFSLDETSLENRKVFYHFVEACIKLPWVKVVLTLRDDYLHYLLEIECYADVNLIDGGVLSNDARYSLGNFTPKAAEAVIRRLTEAAQYYLEAPLIQRLVADLAAETSYVRPIELQVVGAQLQREEITTLHQYEALGSTPKVTLVQRFLAYVVRDCGKPNEEIAKVVLFLLTDKDRSDRLYRPLKTREELEYALSLLGKEFTEEQLDLVLYILVGSGLVFEIPEEPEDRYQLVHDYLAAFVRDEQAPEILTELSVARERQQQAEESERVAKLEAEKLAEANLILEQANKNANQLLTKARIQSNLTASLTISVLLTATLVSRFSTFEEALITLVIAILIVGILLPYVASYSNPSGEAMNQSAENTQELPDIQKSNSDDL